MSAFARSGTSTIGLLFSANQAVVVHRGWIRSLTMVEGGPQEFDVLFGNTVVASTTNGRVTIEDFTQDAIADTKAKTSDDDVMHKLPDTMSEGLINMCPIGKIVIKTPEPPRRQQYYLTVEWAQMFQQKPGTKGESDIDLEPLPCIRMFNLLSFDRASIVERTVPVQLGAS